MIDLLSSVVVAHLMAMKVDLRVTTITMEVVSSQTMAITIKVMVVTKVDINSSNNPLRLNSVVLLGIETISSPALHQQQTAVSSSTLTRTKIS
jgi:hypothetical protein